MENCLAETAILEPFNLLDMLDSIANLNHFFHWKLLFSPPTLQNESEFKPLTEMIRRKFRTSFPQTDEGHLVKKRTVLKDSTVSLIVKEVSPESLHVMETDKESRSRALGGATAVLFMYFDQEESPDEAKQRLQMLMDLKTSFPLAPLLVFSSLELEVTSQHLCLQEFVASGLISGYNVVQVSSGLFNVSQLVRLDESVKKLIKDSPVDFMSGYTSSRLADFVEDFITSKVSSNQLIAYVKVSPHARLCRLLQAILLQALFFHKYYCILSIYSKYAV